jgi:hypothetical protein
MTFIRLSLTVFFIALTLSIGLVSINSPLSVANAQNNALSQSGDDGTQQKTEQSKSSEQNGQVVSGDNSILSGNNLLCQKQDNLDVGVGICPDIAGTIPLGENEVPLTIKTVLRANCDSRNCPIPDGIVHIFVDGKYFDGFMATTHVREGTTERTFQLPVGVSYSIHASGSAYPYPFGYELGNIQGDCYGIDFCNAVMGPNGAKVTVNFHYTRL